MALIKREKQISIRRKCQLLGLNRSDLYCAKKDNITVDDVDVMNQIRDTYLKYPFFRYRKIHAVLQTRWRYLQSKKIQRLMRLAGLKAICPYKKGKQSKAIEHKVYSYLLHDIVISRPNQVWQVDITYIKIKRVFVYLVCLIDVYSRKIMGWNLSAFLDTTSGTEALSKALATAKPDIVNSDQGCQFTSKSWRNMLHSVSMDGKGRWADNIYIERLWRTIKYELVYLHQFDRVEKARNAIANYIDLYNSFRPHQALGYKTPDQLFEKFQKLKVTKNLEALQLPPFREKEALLNF